MSAATLEAVIRAGLADKTDAELLDTYREWDEQWSVEVACIALDLLVERHGGEDGPLSAAIEARLMGDQWPADLTEVYAAALAEQES